MSKMTNNDYELLEMAMETTYASSIRSYIEEADTEECRKQLKKYLQTESISRNKTGAAIAALILRIRLKYA